MDYLYNYFMTLYDDSYLLEVNISLVPINYLFLPNLRYLLHSLKIVKVR